MITPSPKGIEEALKAAATRISQASMENYLPLLIDRLSWAGLTSSQAIAAFLANVAHESGDFGRVVENLNYSAKGLRAVFTSRVSAEKAKELHRKPKEIACWVYANRLGNGDVSSGDGWRYRGRGLIQITGKYNYARASDALGINFVDTPEMMEQPVNALLTALWFWNSRGLTAYAEQGAFRAVVKRINGGYNGLADREDRYNAALDALRADCKKESA